MSLSNQLQTLLSNYLGALGGFFLYYTKRAVPKEREHSSYDFRINLKTG